jgi:hypothetical protein
MVEGPCGQFPGWGQVILNPAEPAYPGPVLYVRGFPLSMRANRRAAWVRQIALTNLFSLTYPENNITYLFSSTHPEHLFFPFVFNNSSRAIFIFF